MGTNNKLNPHMTPSPVIEPGPHWWEASALTTAPSLLPEGNEGNEGKVPCLIIGRNDRQVAKGHKLVARIVVGRYLKDVNYFSGVNTIFLCV